jgi:hypothetical protein
MSQLCAFLAAMWLCCAIDWFKEGYKIAPWAGLGMMAFLLYSSYVGA